MATTFKQLASADRKVIKTRLHEMIPITGSLISGTYGGNAIALANELHIKKYSHGKFESVFDYPHLSSSANHLFDIAVGAWRNGDFATGSSGGYVEGAMQILTGSDNKYNMYDQMASLLVGHDHTGAIRPFDLLGDNEATASQKIHSCVFLNFSRLLVKDEIERGSFTMTLGTSSISAAYATEGPSGFHTPYGAATDSELATISDYGAKTTYKTNSPAGEYSILYKGSKADANAVGHLYYEAGIAVLQLTAGIRDLSRVKLFQSRLQAGAYGTDDHQGILTSSTSGVTSALGGYWDIEQAMVSGTVEQIADGVRHRLRNVEFKNTTDLNSTIYFCRAGASEFNYSSNPTYLSGSEIRIKDGNKFNAPLSYPTTVGLYSNDGELMAVAKLSEALKKDNTTDFTIRVRLDY